MPGMGNGGTGNGASARRMPPALVVALVALAALAVTATRAAARDCHATCQESRATCVDAAKVTKKGCKQQCRNAPDRATCQRECRQGFAAAKTTCKGTVTTCTDDCERPCDDPGDEECVDQCVHGLRECVADVRDTGKACARVCLGGTAVAEHGGFGDHGGDGGDGDDGDHHGGSGGSGGDDCWQAPDPLQCWLERLGGVGQCLAGCAATIEASLDECATAASACRDACTRPPGSASRAFVARPASLLE